MGAFFLFHRESKFNQKPVEKLFLAKGFDSPEKLSLGAYTLWLYRKQFTDALNYFSSGDQLICACGSLFYKGLGYADSLQALLSDYADGSLNRSDIGGNYALIFFNRRSGLLTFAVDPSFVKCVYFDKNRKLLSTDFLAMTEANHGSYTLNRTALAENIVTGGLITPDTYAEEIQRIDNINVTELPGYFPDLTVCDLTPSLTVSVFNYNDAVADANARIDKYFRSVAPVADQYGANLGLTGGFDSRLLLVHAIRHIDRLKVNSFWRENSAEYYNARLLAEAAGREFCSFETAPFAIPEPDNAIDEAFLFFDGQIRSQNRWDEEFNSPSYNRQLSSGYHVGFHGCGGEQYRNADRYYRKTNLDTFIKNEWLFRQCGNVFTDKRLEDETFSNIRTKVIRLLGLKGDRMGLAELKRFQNEVWINANRATRLNVLNQQQFYFAPFTEYKISHAAYEYVPYLGSSLGFQCDMIRQVSPELASVRNNYGFSFADGEPFRSRLASSLLCRIPRSLLYTGYFIMKRGRRTRQKDQGEPGPAHTPGGLGLDYDRFRMNPVLGSSLLSFEFMLKKTALIAK